MIDSLREIQHILNLPELKFAELHSVRWLSMECAVGAMFRSYPALAMCLEQEAVLDATAKGLFCEVSQYKFIATMHMLMDVLPFIERLSKNFQHDSLDFSKVQPLVDSLKDLCDVPGEFITKLEEFTVNCDGDTMYSRPVSESSSEAVRLRIQNNYKFEGFEDSEEEEEDEVEDCSFKPILKYYQQQKDSVTKTFSNYIEMVVENIQDRFQDSQVLNAINALVPKNISGSKSVAMFGNDDVKILVKQFKKHLLSSTECLNEYRQYKNLVSGSYKTETLEAITRTIITKYHDEFPNMTILLKCCTVIPMNSVKCERGFSTQNRIMTRLQTRMNNKTLDDLMTISEEGPSMNEFDFSRALTKWKAEKVRKLNK
ncbi:uncharacterized protein C17orf113-like [Dreissena polymorpha]|uniref:uncharacterized protein C17orf113-like n=1 Tax=Dreissena polymorpha TaxID=45954 RepID=UPI0022645461|nr:uncharacterized protein C17orf113-like [Dreissena polymorpha]